MILLATAHDLFCMHTNETDTGIDLSAAKEMITARCLLGQLSSYLQHHNTYNCKVRKYGTLVYRPNTDFVQAISRLLWEHRKPRVTEYLEHSTEGQATSISKISDDPNNINKLVHEEIGKQLDEERLSPFDFNDINTDMLTAQTDQTLWKAICSITKSVRESRRSSSCSQESQTHTKKARRYFILCCILFCTDARCSRPLHQLITNLIESQGGSTLLIKLLNRLGACASADTLSRFVQYKISTGVSRDIKCKNTFMAISVDNIDFSHGYSRVNVGQQVGCWSGTSVQYIEMNPSLEVINPNTVMSEVETLSRQVSQTEGYCTMNTLTDSSNIREQPMAACHQEVSTRTHRANKKRVHRPSPANSRLKQTRSPAPKIRRRMRTGTECSQPEREPIRETERSFVSTIASNTSTPAKTKALSDFTQTKREEVAMTKLHEELNAYMVQKQSVREQRAGRVFLNIQDYLELTRATHTQKSKVEYRQIIDAVADSKDTMMSLIDDLHKQYIVENKKQFLIVEGDTKIYEVLKSLKSEYGDDLSWLITYPGDCHLLFNYQYPLMKAQAAGYSTAQIQLCAQFKRTHHFILEV